MIVLVFSLFIICHKNVTIIGVSLRFHRQYVVLTILYKDESNF